MRSITIKLGFPKEQKESDCKRHVILVHCTRKDQELARTKVPKTRHVYILTEARLRHDAWFSLRSIHQNLLYINDEERSHAAAWRCPLGPNQQHAFVSQPSQQLYKALPRIPPFFCLTTLKDIESKTSEAPSHGRCVSASFSKSTSHMRMRCSPVAEVIHTVTRHSKQCSCWRYVSVWKGDLYVPWSKRYGRYVQSLPREICYYMNLWRQFHVLFPGTLRILLLEPQRRERNKFIASRASNIITLETWWPCDSYPGRNRILALISRYQNQLRLRDHARTSVLGTSGSKVYINISLTMLLSLCFLLMKMRYWIKEQKPIHDHAWSVCSFLLKTYRSS